LQVSAFEEQEVEVRASAKSQALLRLLEKLPIVVGGLGAVMPKCVFLLFEKEARVEQAL